MVIGDRLRASAHYQFQQKSSGCMSSFIAYIQKYMYRQISNISRTLVGNKIVDHSDVVGAAPTTSSFST